MRSASDAAGWVRLARRIGASLNSDPEYLPLDANGALVVAGAGAAPAATALRIADGDTALGEADVLAGRLAVTDQHAQAQTDAQARATPLRVDTGLAQTTPLTDAQLRAAAVPVATGLVQAQTDAQARATPQPVQTQAGLATDAALVPLLDGLEALLATIRDEQQRRTDPIPAGTAQIGTVIIRTASRTLHVVPSEARITGGMTPELVTSDLSRVALDLSVTAVAGVAPELRVFLDRQGADGVWYPVFSPAARTAVGTLSTTVGQGAVVAQSVASAVRFRWEITGTGPSFTFSASLVGK